MISEPCLDSELEKMKEDMIQNHDLELQTCCMIDKDYEDDTLI